MTTFIKCIKQNKGLSRDLKEQIQAEVNTNIAMGHSPISAVEFTMDKRMDDALKTSGALWDTIVVHHRKLMETAKAAGKDTWEGTREPKAEPEEEVEKPQRQDILPGFKNKTFADILAGRLIPNEEILRTKLTTKEFDALNAVSGYPTSGNKDQRISRFVSYMEIRRQLKDYATTYSGAKAFSDLHSKKDLKAMAATVKAWKSGSKVQLAGSLLSWRDGARRKGLTELITAFEAAGMDATKYKDALETPLGTIGVEAEVMPKKVAQSSHLADWVVKKIEAQKAITWRDLFKQADKAFKGTQGEGVYTPRDAYDAMELGVNRYLLRNVSFIMASGERKSPETIINQLKAIVDFLPTQSKRTLEQEAFQQYSTPPFLSYVANWVANIQTGDTYLEPSAGVGGLAVFARMSNAKEVVVNELSDRRLGLLKLLKFDRYFSEDAAQLNNILPVEIKPTVIVMNPPFSSTAGRLKKNMTTYGAKHVEQALKRLEPGGRLVAVVGKGMGPEAPTFRSWWAKISEDNTVRANIRIAGKEYQKYGTTFGNRLIIIDKIGKSEYTPIIDRVETVNDLPKILEGVRNERQKISQPGQKSEPPSIQPPLPGPTPPGEGPTPGERPPRGKPDDMGPGAGPPGSERGPKGAAGEHDIGDTQPGDALPGPGEREPGEGAPGPGGTTPGEPPLPGDRGDIGISTDPNAELTLDELGDLFDEVANEEAGARPPQAPQTPVTKPAAPGPKPKGPTPSEPSEYGDIADLINAATGVKEKQVPFAEPLMLPDVYEKARPTLVKKYVEFMTGVGANAKAWMQDAVRSLTALKVDMKIAKNWILHFYANHRPEILTRKKEAAKKLAIEKAKKKRLEIEDKIYERYQPSVKIKGSQPHPTLLDESVALADTAPPPGTYRPKLPRVMIDDGLVSDVQVESTIYGGQAHEQILPNGDRRGFFAGHGTGVGKGRIIAAIMRDNWNRGRKKAIWISEKAKLFSDARRDIGYDDARKAVSGIRWIEGAKSIFQLTGTKFRPGRKFQDQDGIMFTTYTTLSKKSNDINSNEEASLADLKIRINQIIDWAGPDFDGVIAFDESHNMSNAIAKRGARGTTDASQMAKAGIMLQNRLPKARVLYVSATGATEVSNLAYAERLGLWGEGTAFSTKGQFINSIEGSGLADMELVARDLKSQGVYLAPTLSYDGVVYDRLEHALDNKQRAKYDELAGAWQIVFRNIQAALGETNQDHDGKKKAGLMSVFWGGEQRFFNQLITTMSVGTVIDHMEKEIEKGNALVVQLVNHGGAQFERTWAGREEGESVEDLDFSPKASLLEYVERSFPVDQYELYTDKDGNTQSRPAFDSNGDPIINREAVAMREALLTRLASIDIPGSPLDVIIEHFGHETVAEVTGRKHRMVIDPDTNEKVVESWSDAKANNDAEAFMDDEKRILIFSEKGGTGRSYHADLDRANQRKRIHYLLQPGWRADKAIQGMGRTHRSNQAQPPEYYLITTDLKAQKRFISSIARRLDQLGALTKGQRQTGSQGIFQAQDNMESDYAKSALYQLYDDIIAGGSEVSLEDFQDQTSLRLVDDEGTPLLGLPVVTQFMNRLLAMKVVPQGILFDEWAQRIDGIIDAAAAAGTLDVGIETITGLSIVKAEDRVVRVGKATGAKTRYVRAELTEPSRRLAFEDIVNADKFYLNAKSGKVWAASPRRTGTDKTGNTYGYRSLTSPAKTTQRINTDVLEDPKKWTEQTDDKATAKLWEAAYSEISEYATRDIHLMTGSLLPIWDRLTGTSTVYRMQTDDGERLLGRVIHARVIEKVLRDLGVTADKKQYTGAELSKEVMDQNSRVRLVNNWNMKRSLVSGEERIELRGPDFDDVATLQKYGVIVERIGSKTRYFIPTGANSGAVIDSIIKYKPVADVQQVYKGPTLQDTMISQPSDINKMFGKGKQVQLTLFGGNQANLFTDKKSEAPRAPKQYPPREGVWLEKTGDISHYGTKIRNDEEAAGLVSFLLNHAAEEAYTVATDKDDNVVQIHKISKGTKGSASVPLIETGGSILRDREIKKVYFIHQHPGGDPDPSKEDIFISRQIARVAELRDIKVRAIVLAAGKGATKLEGPQFIAFNPITGPGLDKISPRTLGPEIKKRVKSNLNTKLEVKERFLKTVRGFYGKEPAQTVNNSVKARAILEQRYNDEPGGLFLDAKLNDIGFMSWSENEPVKEYAARIIAEADRHNAMVLVLNLKTKDKSAELSEQQVKFLTDFTGTFQHHGLMIAEVLVDGKSMKDSGILDKLTPPSNLMLDDSLAGLVKDEVLFSRKVSRPSDPMTVKGVHNVIDPILNEMAVKPPVTVLEKQSGLPEGVRTYLRENNATNDIVVAAFHDGRVYLVAENIENRAEATRALLHEVMGHFGIRAVLGDQVNKTLQSVYVAKRPEIDLIAMEYGFNLKTKEGRLAAADEWLARQAQTNPDSGWVNQLVAAIRKWLRKINANLKFSDTEIRALLGSARQYLRTGQPASIFPPIAFDRKPELADQWYSQMENYLGDKLQDSGTGSSYLQMVNNLAKSGKIKGEELEWSGLKEWLSKYRGKVQKSDIMAYLAENNVKLKEVIRYDDPMGIAEDHLRDDRITWPITDLTAAMPEMSTTFDDEISAQQHDLKITRRAPGDYTLHIDDVYVASADTPEAVQQRAEDEIETIMQSDMRAEADIEWFQSPATEENFETWEGTWFDEMVGEDANFRIDKEDLEGVVVFNTYMNGEPFGLPDGTLEDAKEAVRNEIISNLEDRMTLTGMEEFQAARAQKADYPPRTRHSQWQVEGGTQYRELVIMLPAGDSGPLRSGVPSPVIQGLTTEYKNWLKAQGLPEMSADELIMEQDKINPEQEGYLDDFIRRWDEASEKGEVDLDRDRVTLFVESENKYTGQRQVMVYIDGNWTKTHGATRLTDEEIIDDTIRRRREELAERRKDIGIFKVTAHWDEDNVLTHVRFNERIGANGDRILFIEEVQTDIGKQIYDAEKRLRKDKKDIGARTQDDKQADRALIAKLKNITPFPKTGRLLAMKRIVRYAAENDFNRVAWTTGQMQVDRYDLSKQIKTVDVSLAENGKWDMSIQKIDGDWLEDDDRWTQLDEKGLEEMIGKELAEKIVKKEGEEIAHESWRYAGVDLKVGGEGLRGIYNQILPNELNKFFGKKAWGEAKVEETALDKKDVSGYTIWGEASSGTLRIEVGNGGNVKFPTMEAAEAWIEEHGSPIKVLSLPITPEMKTKALYEGMPMFMKKQGNLDVVSRLPENVRDRFAQARGLPKQSWIEKARERIGYVKAQRHHFPDLYNIHDAREEDQLADILRQHQEVPESAKHQAVQNILKFTRSLSQDEYEIFRIHVILSDMMRDIDEGLLTDVTLGEGDTMPFGFDNVAAIKKSFNEFDQLADQVPSVRKAITDRRTEINRLTRDMVKYKVLKKEVLKHKDYFHHQVLTYWAGNQVKTAGTSSKDVRKHWRPWMAARKGSMLDYNTEYVEAEFAAMAQQIAQIDTAKNLEKIKNVSDIFRDLKTAAKFENIKRFYQEEAARLSRIFKQKISPQEVQSDKELDPLFGYRQNIAMASSNLAQMAFDDKLEVDSEWDDVLDAMAEEHELKKMGIEEGSLGLSERSRIPAGRYFSFLSYLIDKKKPGAMWAATTFKAIAGRNRAIKGGLGQNFVTFRQLMPEGYTVWKPEPGKGWFWANTITDDIMQKVIEGEKALGDQDVRQMLAKGQDLMWVIPEGLASTLDDFKRYPESNSIGQAADWALRAWKQWVLINPRRYLKYNINNFSGDLDITMAYAPGIAKPTALKQALTDLMKWHKHKELDPGVQAEIDNARHKGVIGSGFAVQEVEDVLNIMSMDKWVREVLLGEKPNIARRYWEKAKGSTVLRENMLRLSAYRWFRQALKEGKRVYGASKPHEIDNIKDLDDKAAKLARELIGDYGNISAAGQYIRKRLLPFYSWMEINAPRYVYLMRNLKSEDRFSDAANVRRRMAGIAVKKVAVGGVRLAIKAQMLMAAVLLWNLLAHRDEWEELGEARRRQLHLILGRREDGTIQTIRFQGALSDALSWFGLEDWPADVQDVLKGRNTIQDKLVEVPKSIATKGINAIRPEPKLLFEGLTGETLYPDPFRPRPIRDTLGHVLRTFSLDSIYRQASGKPGRGKNIAEHMLADLKSVIIYDSDPGEQAYYDTRHSVFEWLEKQGIERPSGRPTKRSNALYYYRQSLKYGDLKAAKRYLGKYYDLGGTGRTLLQGVKRAHPLASIPMRKRYSFRETLNGKQQERLKIALAWYENTYRGQDIGIKAEVAKERYGKK